MAIANVNCVLAPVGPATAQGQSLSSGGAAGFESRKLYLMGTATLDGAATAFTANYIDGAQKLFQRIVNISASNVTAPATIGGVANQSIVSGVGAFGALSVGQSVVISGFANAGNNGTFTVNALTTSSIQITNAGAVAESNAPSGNVQANLGGRVLTVQASRAPFSAAGVADTGLATIAVNSVASITDASCLVNLSAAGTASQTVSFVLEVVPTA